MEYIALGYRNSTEAYLPVLNKVIDKGIHSPSRIGRTVELSTVITLRHPMEVVPFVFGRQANHFGMLAEALWILSDVDEVELIEVWNSRIAEFSDDGEHLYGAYGPRLQGAFDHDDPLEEIIRRFETEGLKTRRGVAVILRVEDIFQDTKDFPCNIAVMFKCQMGVLNMTVVNRSNDIHWGLFGVNFPQFAFLQNYMAGRLGIHVGLQTHISDSLHLYTDSPPHKAITSRMREVQRNLGFYQMGGGIFAQTLSINMFNEGWTHSGPGNSSIRDLFEHCMEQDAHTRKFGNTAFIATVVPLLTLYRQIKEKSISREDAVSVLVERVTDSVTWAGAPMVGIPLDWVFACLYTLCHQSKKRDEVVATALENFYNLLRELGSYRKLTSRNRERLRWFLESG